MLVDQISVFLENKSGRLSEVCAILGKSGVNIRALSLADTDEFGILRLIVNDPAKANAALKEAEFVTRITKVIAVEVEDRPGGLADVLKVFEDNNLNVEYMYAFVEKNASRAVMIFRLEDLENALDALKKSNVSLLTNQQVMSL